MVFSVTRKKKLGARQVDWTIVLSLHPEPIPRMKLIACAFILASTVLSRDSSGEDIPKENRIIIDALNNEHRLATFGVTKFSHMTAGM